MSLSAHDSTLSIGIRRLLPVVALALCATWCGCSGERKADNVGKGPKQDDKQPAEEDNQLKPLELFTPPPLAELDAKAEWVDMPVLDATKLLRDEQAKHPQLVPISEALTLRNTSPEANAKIASAFGRLPADDSMQVNYDATWIRWLSGDVNSLNPIMSSSAIESYVLGAVGFGLFSFDWNMTPFAAAEVVKSWQQSKDHMLDKVVMRDDLTWSDGKPITAHDIAFSFQTIMNPLVPVPAQRSGTDKLRWVHAYDDRTLVYFHRDALSTNIWNVNFSVIPQHIYEPFIKRLGPNLKWEQLLNDAAFNSMENRPVVGGAYEIVKRTFGQEIVCQRRESYYMHNGKQVRDKPYFKEIRFKVIADPTVALIALKSGELEEVELRASQWTSQTIDEEFYRRNTKVSAPEWTYFQFAWNLQTPFFSDLRVRQAMSYAFDHEEMLKNICGGLYAPCTGIFHPESWMAPKTPLQSYKQDLPKAEALLDAAGWRDTDGDGIRDKIIEGKKVPFDFSILVRSDPERIRIVELLKFNLSQIGVACNISVVETTTYMQRTLDKKFQAAMGGWGTGADPDTSDNLWVTGEARNMVSYSNKEVDELFKKGREEFDRAKRGEIYARIAELIYADQPYTFLYYRNSFFGFNKQLRGLNFSPRGPYSYSPGSASLWKPLAE